jgi:hypothetical protein
MFIRSPRLLVMGYAERRASTISWVGASDETTAALAMHEIGINGMSSGMPIATRYQNLGCPMCSTVCGD